MALEEGHSIEEAREFAAHYALGTLPAAETTDYERHLEDGCALCVQELREMEATSSELALIAPPEAPPPRLREKLLELVRLDAARPADTDPQVWQRWKGTSSTTSSSADRSTGWISIRSGEEAWEDTGLPGISVR